MIFDSFSESLSETLDYIQQECTRGIADRRHALRQIYLSTLAESYPEIRTVVFRRLNWSEKKIFFHTDYRSTKYQQLLKSPHACLLGYNHAQKYQIRFRGKIVLHHLNSTAQSAWDNVGISSRRCYMTLEPPGTAISKAWSGLDPVFENQKPTAEQTQNAFSNFVLCEFKIFEIEWLYLRALGHRRSLYVFDDQAQLIKSQWLTP